MLISSYIKYFFLAHSAYATSEDHTKGVKVLSTSDALLLVQLRASSVDGQVQVGHGREDFAFSSDLRSMAEGNASIRNEPCPGHFCKCRLPKGGPKCDNELEVWWLHAPKTGSSFKGSTSICKTQPHGTHDPLPAWGDNALGQVVAVFREPSQRLASSWSYLLGGANCWGWGCEDQDALKQILKKGYTAATDATLGKSYLGCQTNMVIGKKCMAGTPSNPQQDAQRAMDKVDKFLFVGLLEEWALSICLFNYKTTGVRFVSECQLANTRPTKGKGEEEYDTSGYPRDVADETLYAHVVKRFNKEISLHGISKQSCSFDEEGKPFHELISQEFWPDLV